MACLLDQLLPRILPQGIEYQTIPHHGKSDLERSIPRKLRAWNEPGDIRFVIVHDQDNADCVVLKEQLMRICDGYGKRVLVRIACQELEAWYFGDMQALARAYGNKKIAAYSGKSKYRVPDKIPKPKDDLYALIPEHQQLSGALRIAPHMDIDHNTSASFNAFVQGIRRFTC